MPPPSPGPKERGIHRVIRRSFHRGHGAPKICRCMVGLSRLRARWRTGVGQGTGWRRRPDPTRRIGFAGIDCRFDTAEIVSRNRPRVSDGMKYLRRPRRLDNIAPRFSWRSRPCAMADAMDQSCIGDGSLSERRRASIPIIVVRRGVHMACVDRKQIPASRVVSLYRFRLSAGFLRKWDTN